MENNKQEVKMLYRSNTNRVIFGVCGGLGEYFAVDPILFRLIFTVLIFCGGAGLIIYIILAVLIPSNPSTVHHTENKTEPIDVHKRVQELAAELRELKRNHKGHKGGTFRLLFGLLILIVGTGMLAQSLNLIPNFYFNFSSMFAYFWPVVIILLGLSIISRGLRNF